MNHNAHSVYSTRVQSMLPNVDHGPLYTRVNKSTQGADYSTKYSLQPSVHLIKIVQSNVQYVHHLRLYPWYQCVTLIHICICTCKYKPKYKYLYFYTIFFVNLSIVIFVFTFYFTLNIFQTF